MPAERVFLTIATCLVGLIVALAFLLPVVQVVIFIFANCTPNLARALATNGVALVSIKPYTSALIAVLTFVPILQALVLCALIDSPRFSHKSKARATRVCYVLWLVLVVCFVVLAGPGRYFRKPESLLWKVDGYAIIDPREMAFAAEFNDVVCRAQVQEACRKGTLGSLNALLPQAEWQDDQSMQSIAERCRPFANGTAVQHSSEPRYCNVCVRLAPVDHPDRLVNSITETTNGWCGHVVLETQLKRWSSNWVRLCRGSWW